MPAQMWSRSAPLSNSPLAVFFSDGSSQDLTTAVSWSTSGPAAVVDTAGLATGQSTGSVTVVATSYDLTGSASLTVGPAGLTAISLFPDPTTVPVGGSVQFVATGTFSDGTTQDVTGVNWSSSSPAVAAVDNDGIVTAISAGTATLTASVGTVSDTADVNATGDISVPLNCGATKQDGSRHQPAGSSDRYVQ